MDKRTDLEHVAALAKAARMTALWTVVHHLKARLTGYAAPPPEPRQAAPRHAVCDTMALPPVNPTGPRSSWAWRPARPLGPRWRGLPPLSDSPRPAVAG